MEKFVTQLTPITRQELFGRNTTPRLFKQGARDIPFGQGASSIYVDGVNGDASNDGESWLTSMATIQAAIDISKSWANIFIRAGTYAENLTIATQKINLIGERRASVIIAPSTGTALTLTTDYCNVSHLTAQSPGTNSINITGDRNKLDYITVQNKNMSVAGDFNEVSQVWVRSAVADAIAISGNYADIHHNMVNGAYAGIVGTNADYAQVYDNDISNCTVAGIKLDSASSNNTIFHNNLVDNYVQAQDAGSSNQWFENFYDDHTTDSDYTGCADTAYQFTTGYDRHPVSSRNAWKRRTLGIVLT